MNADILEDKMRHGEISASEYKDMQKIFGDYSKDGAFAAIKRKAGDTSGTGSLGEIIYMIEGLGEIKTSDYVFEKDGVDQATHDYLHTLEAVGVDALP